MPLASTYDQQQAPQRHARQHCEWGGVRRRVELAAGLFGLLIQLAIWVRTGAVAGLRAHLHQAALVAIHSSCVALTLMLPHDTWRRYRVWMISVLRFSIVVVPSHRSPTEGSAVLLHHGATPGLGGMLVDYLRVALGTRVLLQMVAGFILHQPPLAVLLQQSIIMALVSNSEAYCGTPLLDNPRAAQRMARFSGWLDCVPLFTVPLTSASALHRQGDSRCICVALLNMHQAVIGVLVPTVLSALTSGTPEEPPPRQQQEQQQEQGRRSQPPLWGKLCGMASGLETVWQQANTVVHEACTGAGMPVVQLLLAAWLLTGNLWMLAAAMAERDS